MAQNKLTKEQRSERMKEAWARRKAREGQVEGQKPIEGFVDPPAETPEKREVQQDGRAAQAQGDDTITFHFLEDGFTAFGQIWYRGQELTVGKNSKRYQETLDTKGRSWLDLDPDEQFKRWDKQMFALGPWRGRTLEDALKEYEALNEETDPEERARIEKRIARQSMPVGSGFLARK